MTKDGRKYPCTDNTNKDVGQFLKYLQLLLWHLVRLKKKLSVFFNRMYLQKRNIYIYIYICTRVSLKYLRKSIISFFLSLSLSLTHTHTHIHTHTYQLLFLLLSGNSKYAIYISLSKSKTWAWHALKAYFASKKSLKISYFQTPGNLHLYIYIYIYHSNTHIPISTLSHTLLFMNSLSICT